MPIEHVVIAGGGAAGWLAASLLARAIGDGMTAISVIDGGESAGPDVSLGLAQPTALLLPATLEALALAGHNEDALIGVSRGTFAVGTALASWDQTGAARFAGFGDIGAPMGAVAFPQLVARLRADGDTVNLANFMLGALCAQTGRFRRPAPGDRSVLGTIAYGVHVGLPGFAAAMRADALARGVRIVAGNVRGAVFDSDGLAIALQTDDGAPVAGDLFIDALGAATPLGGDFEDWSAWLPCDRVAFRLAATDTTPAAYRHVEAHTAGWQAFTPLQGAVAETFVYRADAIVDGPEGAPFRSGRRCKAWRGNIVAIGGAAVVIDPIADTPLQLAVSAIIRLISLFPHDRGCRAESAEYNRQTEEQLACARDLAALHYALAQRPEPFWSRCRDVEPPVELANRIAVFASCGRVPLHDGELFDDAEWVALFDAMGVHARHYSALANALSPASIRDHCGKVRSAMLAAIGTMPPHGEYLHMVAR